MATSARRAPRPRADRGRGELAARLRSLQPEIEESALTRAYAIADPAGSPEPAYAEGLRTAVSVAVDYGIAGVEGEGGAPEIPPALLVQARVAARGGIGLDVVLRRYFAGYTLLNDYIVEEAKRDGLLRGGELQRLLSTQATLFDRLVAAVSREHASQAAICASRLEEGHLERIKLLLEGDLPHAAELAYDFDASHLGVVAVGPGGSDSLRDIAADLDRRALIARPAEEVAWAWLGGRRQVATEEIDRLIQADLPGELSLAIGEPGQGIAGWRLTHRQAKAALPVGLRSSERIVRYRDVALTASMLQDDVLMASLERLYLAPLGRREGDVLRPTLRAYFDAEGNTSSAAARLGISRQAVTKRLRRAENRLGRSLADCALELDAALKLERLRGTQPGRAVATPPSPD